MAIGDVHKITTRFSIPNSAKLIGPGFHVEEIDAVADVAVTAGPIVAAFWTDIITVFSSDVVLQAITARRVNIVGGVEKIYDTGLPIAGSESAGQNYSPTSSIIVSLRTALAGKSFRGRYYLPTPSEGDATGDLSAAAAQLVADSFLTMMTDLLAADLGVTVWSPTLASSELVSDCYVDQRLRSQRRRQERRPAYKHGV